jgi:hypothetical protein
MREGLALSQTLSHMDTPTILKLFVIIYLPANQISFIIPIRPLVQTA